MKINIFKCNKFNILSYIFCFSSFFNGSAFSLYCVVITSVSLRKEMRPPASTTALLAPFILSFISQKHTPRTYYTEARHGAECWGYSSGRHTHITALWGLQSTSQRVPLPQQYQRELKLEFPSWKGSRRSLHCSPYFKNNIHLL